MHHQFWNSWRFLRSARKRTYTHLHIHIQRHTLAALSNSGMLKAVDEVVKRPSFDKSFFLPRTLFSNFLFQPILYSHCHPLSPPLVQDMSAAFFSPWRTDTQHKLFPQPCRVARGQGEDSGHQRHITSSILSFEEKKRLTSAYSFHIKSP